MNFTLFAILYVAVGLIVTILFLRFCELSDGKLQDSNFDFSVFFLFIWPIGLVAVVICLLYYYVRMLLKSLYELIFRKEKEHD